MESSSVPLNVNELLVRVLEHLDADATMIDGLVGQSLQNLDVLREKLMQIEELAVEVAIEDNEQLKKDWREIVATLWRQHAREPRPADNWLVAVTTDDRPLRPFKETNISRTQKTAIRRQVQEQCQQLEQSDIFQIDDIKSLTRLVAQAAALARPFAADQTLQVELFEYLFAKLNFGLQHAYRRQHQRRSRGHHPRAPLMALLIFLQRHLLQYYGRIHLALQYDREFRRRHTWTQCRCTFCQRQGHTTDRCLQRWAHCCRFCLDFVGHGSWQCPSEVHRARLEKHLQVVFRRMAPIASEKYIDQLKQLLLIIAKTDILLVPFSKNNQFQSKLVAAVAELLPPGSTLRGQISTADCLTLAKRRLQVHIINMAIERNRYYANRVTRHCTDSKIIQTICTHCQLVGHSADLCAERNGLLCLRCLCYGHSQTICPSLYPRNVSLYDVWCQ